MSENLEKVRRELDRYQHPLFIFSARPAGENVEVVIEFCTPTEGVHTYIYPMRPREMEHPQFPWSFQKQLYDCLHDYVIEMFARNPQLEE